MSILRNKLVLYPSILIVTCVINFLLFIIVPALDHLLGKSFLNQDKTIEQNQVVAELIQEKKKKPKQVKKRIRQVNTRKSSSSMQGSKMKFAPDLGVSGGGDGVAMEGQDLSAVIFNQGEVDQDVIPVKRPRPSYPRNLKRRNIEGMVICEIVIRRDGKVELIKILKSSHPGFTKLVRQTVNKWYFKPAMNNGIPVKQRIKQRFPFTLTKSQ